MGFKTPHFFQSSRLRILMGCWFCILCLFIMEMVFLIAWRQRDAAQLTFATFDSKVSRWVSLQVFFRTIYQICYLLNKLIKTITISILEQFITWKKRPQKLPNRPKSSPNLNWFIYFSQKFFCTMGHRNFCTEAFLQKFWL